MRPICHIILALPLLFTGCAGPALHRARSHFYHGRLDQAAVDLEEAEVHDNDRVLLWMERGMIQQARGEYRKSCRDFLKAAERIEELYTYSISKGTASFVINDYVQDFRGAPFERTLMHAFTAKNYLALSDWDDAAVESRLIIQSLLPERKGKYPDNAYFRYMAGFCLETIDDNSNAALQYRQANTLSTTVRIDDKTGRLSWQTTNRVSRAVSSKSWKTELVCFVSSGKAPSGPPMANRPWYRGTPAWAEIYSKGVYLGRSYTLADTVDLAFTTEQVAAARKTAKTVTRIAIKEGIASSVEMENELLGELVRLILIVLLEQPDVRRWETLPRWLGVARVPCPPDLTEYDAVFKTGGGATLGTVHVEQPITRHRQKFISFCRDLKLVPATTPGVGKK